MTNPRRAARRLLDRGAISALAAALLLSAAAPIAAQQRQNPTRDGGGGGGDSGGGRVAVPRATPSTPSSSTPSTRSGSDSPSRTARPREGGGSSEPSRQPPTRSRGRSGGGYYHHGGYYYDPFYTPYWYGFWYRGYPAWYYGPGAYSYPYRHGYDDRNALGALDLDVSPAKAEVYLDGHYIGVVDQFDGFPQYLWLEKGTYDLVLFKDGFRTVSRQLTVYPGLVISVDDRMEPGESVKPEDLATKTHERRDARIRDEEERRAQIEREGRDGRGDRDDRGDRDGGDWRDRVRDDRDHWRDGEAEEGRSTRDRGRVRIDVEPGDASVYLDGKFVGTGAELAELRSGLLLEPGAHKLSIVRPGYKAEEKQFEVEAGETTDLEIELDSYE